MQSAERPDYGRWERIPGAARHGVLVVHGIGDPRPGDILHGFFNGLYNYVHAKVVSQRGYAAQAGVSMHTDLAGQRARVVVGDPETGEVDDLIIREVWWAKAFRPLDFWRVLQWLTRQTLRVARLVVRGDARWRQLWTYLILWWLVPLALLVPLLLMVAPALLQWFPVLRGPLNSLSQRLQKLGSTFLVGSVGDIATYTLDILYASEIRQVLEREVEWMEPFVDDIHVVSHSLGSLIAYEVLSRTMRTAVEEGSLQGRLRTLITAGSPLDKVSWFLKPEHRYRFARDLPPGIRWVNLYTAYDLVADKLARYGSRPTNALLVNKEIPFLAIAQDHVTYWQNYEAMEHVLRCVASSAVLSSPVSRPKGLRTKAGEIGRALWRQVRRVS